MNDTSAYQPYVEAKWGLMNHWYPALFSAELAEDGGAGAPVVGVQIAGVPIVLRRVDGVAYALRDECLHRGVKLSLQPTCLTRSTLTCWYHGFTYDLADGRLSAIVVSPEDPLIGQVQLQSYPVVERNGLVFVFVGDADFGSPPPLESDLPPMVDAASRHWSPHLADDGAIVLGIRRRVASNWRLGCENGFDPGHIFIHRNTTLVRAQGWNMPLGLRPVGSAAVSWLEADDGPTEWVTSSAATPTCRWPSILSWVSTLWVTQHRPAVAPRCGCRAASTSRTSPSEAWPSSSSTSRSMTRPMSTGS
jgi:phenylpropionate dioxygenase-like ring-hydroxylating dioxygenase large terminal subunit